MTESGTVRPDVVDAIVGVLRGSDPAGHPFCSRGG